MTETVYVVTSTRYEIEDIDVGGSLRTYVLGFASSERREIERAYEGKGLMCVRVEPINIAHFESAGLEALAA